MQNIVNNAHEYEYDTWLIPQWPQIASIKNHNCNSKPLMNSFDSTVIHSIHRQEKRKLYSMDSEVNTSMKVSKFDGHTLQEPYQLVVVKQPEEQHRARYLSEGSRGAIKDKTGTSYCTIQLLGYHRPTHVDIFVASVTNPIVPHPLYRLIPVNGKTPNVTPCRKVVYKNGLEYLRILLRPENSMTAILDCMGILKICSYDAKNRRNNSQKKEQKNSIQNTVRIIFKAYIPKNDTLIPTKVNEECDDLDESNYIVVQGESEPIRCVQQLGIPEILKMSLNSAQANGGHELFIIGRNFDRNTKCHIVCTVPMYHNVYRNGVVSVTVVCASKSSHPRNFTYKACEHMEEEDEWRPPGSPRLAPFSEEYSEYSNSNAYSSSQAYSYSSNHLHSNDSHSSIKSDKEKYYTDFYQTTTPTYIDGRQNTTVQRPTNFVQTSTNPTYAPPNLHTLQTSPSTDDLDMCFGPPEIKQLPFCS